MRHELRFAPLLEHVEEVTLDEYVALRPTGVKWRDAVVKWLWAAVERLGRLEPYPLNITTYSYGPEARKKVCDLIDPMCMEAVRRGLRLGECVVLLGEKEFHDVMTSRFATPPFMALPGHDFEYYHNGARATIRGLPVYVAPSMSGAVVVPKDILLRR